MKRTAATLHHISFPLAAGVLLIMAFALFTGACELPTLPEYLEDRSRRSEEAAFVPVEDITGLPDGTGVGVLLELTPVITPENAANKTVAWTVSSPGTTEAYIVDGVFLAQALGTAHITATVANGQAPGTDFVKEFTITVTEEFVPVTDITFTCPDTFVSGYFLTLRAAVQPQDATNKVIEWSLVDSETTAAGASVAGNVLSAPDAGIAVVRATVTNGTNRDPPEDFTKDFSITVTEKPSEIVEYDIDYNLNGGILPGGAPLTYRTDQLPLILPTPTLANHNTFLGWYDNAQFQGNPAAALLAGSTGHKEFWAKWRSATPTVSPASVVKSLNGMANVPFTLTNSPAFADSSDWKVYTTLAGSALASGVTASSSGTTLTLSHASDVPAGTYYVTVTEPGMAESNRLVLAVLWEYSLSFNWNEGTPPESVPSIYRTSELPLTLPRPTRDGYCFLGWDIPGRWMLPVGTSGAMTLEADWAVNSIDVGSPESSGWPYSNGIITIVDGADVTLTGSTGSNRVVVASGATARVTLRNVAISNGGSHVVVFNGTGATVTLLLEGNNTVTASMSSVVEMSMGCYAFKVTNLIIDSVSSVNAGTDASSRNTLGTLRAAGGGWGDASWGDDVGGAFGGSVTLLGGVVTAESGYFNYRAVNGSLTAKGGVFIGQRNVSSFTRPADSLAVVFLVSAPSAAYQDDHGDLAVCGSEVSISENTLTLNEDLTIPSGATLRVPSGWTLNTGGFLTNNGTIINDGTISGNIGGTGTVTP